MKTKIIALTIAVILLLIPTIAYAERVQMPGSGWEPLGLNASVFCRLGQRLTIPERELTSIGYRVRRVGNATGDVIFSIYDWNTLTPIVSKVWGDASELPDSGADYIEVELDPPIKLNREVIICVEYYGGNATDYCEAGYFSGNKKDGETYMNYYHYGVWHDIGEAEEGSYCYEYKNGEPSNGNGETPPPPPTDNGFPLWGIVVIIASVMIITVIAINAKHRKPQKHTASESKDDYNLGG